MAAVTCREMRECEAIAMAAGWTEEQLLDQAGTRLGIAIGRFFPQPGTAVAYLGKGHNAGDALVALGILRRRFGWNIRIRKAFDRQECAPLTCRKWTELEAEGPVPDGPIPWRDADRPLVLIDGLLGIGGKGALRGPMAELAAEMRRLRNSAAARVAAVDQPSGLDADTGTANPGCVRADVTFMIGNAKHGLLCGHAADDVGALALVPVEILESSGSGDLALISPQTLPFGKSPRPFDFHKGRAGHVGIIAGSTLYPGAAAMAAVGALRGGAGLVTLHAPQDAMPAIAARCPPEIILRTLHSPDDYSSVGGDALVIGCGLGTPDAPHQDALLKLIEHREIPTVIDADALNLVARREAIGILKSRHLLTPHPGEFRRLAPDLTSLNREQAAREFTRRTQATLLLKGGRTIVTRDLEPLWCNSTGSPALATGGQGDLLAGVLGALLATGRPPLEAACLGAWLCGRAAETALLDRRFSEESLTPCDVARYLGTAFNDWKACLR